MKFMCEPRRLTIKLEGMEQLWALKRKLQLSPATIAAIDFIPQQPALQDFKGRLRFPGTALPWRFLAGSYIQHGQREFWYVHLHQEGLITIDCKPGTFEYDRIRLSCPPDIAQDITDWWRGAR